MPHHQQTQPHPQQQHQEQQRQQQEQQQQQQQQHVRPSVNHKPNEYFVDEDNDEDDNDNEDYQHRQHHQHQRRPALPPPLYTQTRVVQPPAAASTSIAPATAPVSQPRNSTTNAASSHVAIPLSFISSSSSSSSASDVIATVTTQQLAHGSNSNRTTTNAPTVIRNTNAVEDDDDDDDANNRTSNKKPTMTTESNKNSSAATRHDDDDSDGELECRICRESHGPLVCPCLCKTPVHSACLQRWVSVRADALFPLLSPSLRHACEICRHPFDYSKMRIPLSSSSSSSASASIVAGRAPSSASASVTAAAISSWYSITTGFFSLSNGYNGGYGPGISGGGSGEAFCAAFFTVETCLFVFLFVLAVMGHALFVMGVFKDVETDEHQHKRVVLAIANAIVTFALLLCVQKIVVRWLRETHYTVSTIQPSNQLPPPPPTPSGEFMFHGHGSASRCTTVSQIFLGAVLSVVAAAEIFLIIRELPLGGLA